MLAWSERRGDPIGCPFLDVRRRADPRCELRKDTLTGRKHGVLCCGLPARCEVPELRERELRRRERETRLSDRPASVWCRLARRWR